jgi:hypothetical protein
MPVSEIPIWIEGKHDKLFLKLEKRNPMKPWGPVE